MEKSLDYYSTVDVETKNHEKNRKILSILETMRPKPSPFEFVRVGGAGDGAYLVPDDLEKISACFSPGVNNRKTFEDELTNKYDITCHMCDYSSDIDKINTSLITGKQTFDKLWLEPDTNPDSISLSNWVEKYGCQYNNSLLLQMDIEGAEHEVFGGITRETLRLVNHWVVECHPAPGTTPETISRILSSASFDVERVDKPLGMALLFARR